MQIASKTFKFVEEHSKKLSVESNLRSAKKANIPKKQLKTKIPKTHLTPISKLFRFFFPRQHESTVVSQTTESLRLEVHLSPFPCFRHDSVTTWSWAVFFFLLFSHHSFTSLFFRFWFQEAGWFLFSMGLFFDRRSAVVSWFGGLLNSGWGGFLPFIALSWCFIQGFLQIFWGSDNCISSKQSQRLEINPAKITKRAVLLLLCKGGVALVTESQNGVQHQHGSHIPFK